MREPLVWPSDVSGIESDTVLTCPWIQVIRIGRRRAGVSLRQLAVRAGTSHATLVGL